MQRNPLLALSFLVALAMPLAGAPASAGAPVPVKGVTMPQNGLVPVHGCHDFFDGGPIVGDGEVVRHMHRKGDCRVILENPRDERRLDRFDRRDRYDRFDRRDRRDRYDRYDRRDFRGGDHEHCHGRPDYHWHRGFGRSFHRHSQRDCDIRVLDR